MIIRFPFLFFILPFIEIYLLIQLAEEIGGGNVLLFILGTAIFGILLMKRQGSSMLQQINQSFAQRAMPAQSMSNGFFVFAGGLLLFAPGVLTDIVGVSLLFPPTRFLWKKYFSSRWSSGIASGKVHVHRTYQQYSQSSSEPVMQASPTMSRDPHVIDIQAQSITIEKKEEP